MSLCRNRPPSGDFGDSQRGEVRSGESLFELLQNEGLQALLKCLHYKDCECLCKA